MSIFTEVSALKSCAMRMLENAAYILRELPGLTMPDDLRKRIENLCSEWVGCKHDVINELGEISSTSKESFEEVAERKARLARGWIIQAVRASEPCVTTCQEAARVGTAHHAIPILLMESAVNILSALPPRSNRISHEH